MEGIYLVYAFVVGTIVASFLGVVVIRGFSYSGLLGRSRCDNCNHDLDWVDLLPILGWLFRRGKCKYCKKDISIRNPLGEIFLGLCFLLFAHFILSSTLGVLSIILISVILLIFSYLAVYDIWKLEIPTIAIAIMTVLAVLYRVIEVGIPNLWWLFVLFIPILVIFIISRLYKRQAFGGGDYLIMFVMALLLEARALFISYEVSILTAAIVAVFLLFVLRVDPKKYKLPLVPFLLFGWLIALNFAEAIWDFLFLV